jgi:hypothetical protein
MDKRESDRERAYSKLFVPRPNAVKDAPGTMNNQMFEKFSLYKPVKVSYSNGLPRHARLG